MRRLLPLPLLLALAACQTPQEACLSDLRAEEAVLDGLIRETQGNLARGYAIREEQVVREVRDVCEVEVVDADGVERTRRTFCDRTEVRDVERPVAINPADEQAKLDGLLERRAALAASRTDRLLACQALPDA